MHALRLRLPHSFARRHAVCATLLCLAAALVAQTEKWETYNYPADGFRASFPAEPTLQQNRKQAAAGTILMDSYCAQASAASLCATVIDQGPEATGLTPEALLNRAKLSVLAVPKSHELHEQEIDLDGHKGVEIETESETFHTLIRIYLVDHTLYQTIVVSPIGTPYAGAHRFLDSFKLIARVRK